MLDRYPEQYQFGQRNAFVRWSRYLLHSYFADHGRSDKPGLFCSSTSVSSGNGSATPYITAWCVQRSAEYSIIPTRADTARPCFTQVIYFASIGIFADELILPQGWIAGQWVWGTTVYVATLVTVLLKAALISE